MREIELPKDMTMRQLALFLGPNKVLRWHYGRG